MKTCTKCGRELPATTEYFHRHPTGDGLKPRCKECRCADVRPYYTPVYPDRIQARATAKVAGRPRRRMVGALHKLVGVDLHNRGCQWRLGGWVLPYSVDDFMAHMEKLFLPGMTWKKYGGAGWEIDHIRPRSSFRYRSANDPEFQECWALNNLRPMWRLENRRKGSAWAC